MVHIKSLSELEGAPHANAFPSEEPKTIRLTLSEGEHVEPHAHPDREIVLYLVSGSLELQLDGEPYQVNQGDVVHFDGAQEISPVAKADSTALLVLAAKRDGPDSPEGNL
ncbi:MULTISPECIES: cupin domain-containing protein [Halobacteriales]|uniref:cupin domain-containing protein n=1 Tax=Halobacteriales TaxID=2235 RepID=UPI0020C3001F|nr:cupin domain-containing protein [Halomarina sp. BND7]